MATDNKIFLTQEGYDKLRKELEYLQSEERKKVQEEIRIAKGFGDLSENAEYSAAREHQARVEGQIQELQYKLEHAVILSESAAGSNAATIGCFVTVYDRAYEEEDTYKLVDATGVDPMNMCISNESPIGSALVGSHVGDVVEVATPAGIIQLEIRKITR